MMNAPDLRTRHLADSFGLGSLDMSALARSAPPMASFALRAAGLARAAHPLRRSPPMYRNRLPAAPSRGEFASTIGRLGRVLRLVSVALALTSPAAAQSAGGPASLDTNQRLARAIYKELIEINTMDSVGSTTTAAEAMAKRFLAAGFPAKDVQVLGPRPDKGNLVVRYHGTGVRKPLLLLAHLDVVAALKSDWSMDPFTFIEKDGYFYGRGTSDDKAMAAIFVANLLRYKQEGYVPDRDVILALTADEEGGTANGVQWLLANHRDLIDAAYALNEGGGGSLRDGKPFQHNVQATEKVYTDFTLTVRNAGGHSSVPRRDNAIYQLAAGLVRLQQFAFPVGLNEVTRGFFERTATIEKPQMAAAMRAIVKNPNDKAAAATLSADPRYNSMLRTTCVATRLFGGHANNALPQLATANVNCRMLPDAKPADVRATIIRALADTAIAVSPVDDIPYAAPSPLMPELMGSVEQLTKQMFGTIPVIPTMSTGATDGRWLRGGGIPTYGVSGLFGDPTDIRAHGRDERMMVKSFFDGQEFLYRLVRQLSSGKQPIS
jgi:acetylornithine deacetylase/succinyl-diaminopimelate desuccinylase-like protein